MTPVARAGHAGRDAPVLLCITGLTIGYGDITVKTGAGRIIAVLIGFSGGFFTGLILAGAVETIRKTLQVSDDSE
jgi:hypothetical protein